MQPFTLLAILCFLMPSGIQAQDNQEPPHACFHLDQEREIPIPLLQKKMETNRFIHDFSTGEEWAGKQVFVKIPGMRFPYKVRINGFVFGSDPGTGLPAEFNITPLLKEETNAIELEPDLTGPEADPAPCVQCKGVTLVIRDNIHVRDLVVSSYQGYGTTETLVRFHLFIKSYLTEKNRGRNIRLLVTDPEGNPVISETQALGAPLTFGQETEMIMDNLLTEPIPWSPLHPRLYRLEIQLSETGKKEFESLTTAFGFRTAVVADSVIMVNGDTLHPVFALPDLASSLSSLTETEIVNLIEDKVFNAIRTNEPLPCNLVNLFDRSGVLVIREKENPGIRADRSHVNSPSIIRVN
ncbi:MAG: hypothetical protein KAT15_12730 [Bacteroidales bacterium]|nr:hypothetical protein [Bacteroidales bacterium]